MKFLRWMLPLALLLMFAMPGMAADSGPPGDLVIEQAMAGHLDPVPVLEAQDSFLTPLLAVIKIRSWVDLNSTDELPAPNSTQANQDAKLRLGPYAFQMRITVWSAFLEPVGGVTFCHCTKPRAVEHSLLV